MRKYLSLVLSTIFTFSIIEGVFSQEITAPLVLENKKQNEYLITKGFPIIRDIKYIGILYISKIDEYEGKQLFIIKEGSDNPVLLEGTAVLPFKLKKEKPDFLLEYDASLPKKGSLSLNNAIGMKWIFIDSDAKFSFKGFLFRTVSSNASIEFLETGVLLKQFEVHKK